VSADRTLTELLKLMVCVWCGGRIEWCGDGSAYVHVGTCDESCSHGEHTATPIFD
jgi:hypothetical protein